MFLIKKGTWCFFSICDATVQKYYFCKNNSGVMKTRKKKLKYKWNRKSKIINKSRYDFRSFLQLKIIGLYKIFLTLHISKNLHFCPQDTSPHYSIFQSANDKHRWDHLLLHNFFISFIYCRNYCKKPSTDPIKIRISIIKRWVYCFQIGLNKIVVINILLRRVFLSRTPVHYNDRYNYTIVNGNIVFRTDDCAVNGWYLFEHR